MVFMAKRTTITVGEETWKRILMMKRPGDTMDDVVSRVLDEREEFQEEMEDLRERIEELEEEIDELEAQLEDT